jgi:uncharacterized protein (UPF0335 family)
MALSNTNPALTAFVDRIERLEDEVAATKLDLKEVYAEAKGQGYDVKILRKLIGLRKRKPEAVAEEQAVLEMYAAAVGMDVFS